jgi:hypothetical protein
MDCAALRVISTEIVLLQSESRERRASWPGGTT